MLATIKSEFRKLMSVRSTYVIIFLSMALIVLMSFYVQGYNGSLNGAITNLALRDISMNTLSAISIFIAIIAVLQVVHEYRHNTIVYTLTASNSRTKALVSKILVLFGFSLIFSVLTLVFSLCCFYVGVALGGASLPPQLIDWPSVIGRGLFYNMAFASLGLIIAYLSRNIAAAIAILLLVPSTVEPLLGVLLKGNAVYLPFSALSRVIISDGQQAMSVGELSVQRALVVSAIYLIVGWIVTWQLFLRRDAN